MSRKPISIPPGRKPKRWQDRSTPMCASASACNRPRSSNCRAACSRAEQSPVQSEPLLAAFFMPLHRRAVLLNIFAKHRTPAKTTIPGQQPRPGTAANRRLRGLSPLKRCRLLHPGMAPIISATVQSTGTCNRSGRGREVRDKGNAGDCCIALSGSEDLLSPRRHTMTAKAALDIPVIPPLDPARFIEVDLYSQEIKADPSPWFLQWADKPPFYVMVDGRPNAVICRHEQVKWALTDYETISAVPQPGWGAEYMDYFNGRRIVVELNPPEHTRMRRLMQPAFTPRRVSQFQQGIDDLADELIEQVATKGEFDMITEFAQPLVYRLLLGTVFEFPQKDWPILTNFSHALELVATVPAGAPKPQAYLDAYDAAMKYCGDLIEQRRLEPKDDLISSIIATHDA